MMTGLFSALILLPWCAAGFLLWRSDDRFRHRQTVVVLTTTLVAAGCLGFAVMDAKPQVVIGTVSDLIETTAIGNLWAWSADRFSLEMVAALMVIFAAAAALLPDESPSAWLLTSLIAAVVPMWWWSQSVWGLIGISVVTSFLMLILPAITFPVGTPAAARTLWVATMLGHVALVMAIVAGRAGLGDAYGDPVAVGEFAAMRPATAMFVALWSWLGVLACAGQLPFCVNFDAVGTYPPRAWVFAVGMGVFALAHRWCDLHRGWWSAAPSMTNLILSVALTSALLCAWFALCTSDLRVRAAYVTAAMLSLSWGPLTSGEDVGRVWSAATIIGSLSLATWFWCVTVTPRSTTTTEPENAPAWIRILTGGDLHGTSSFIAATRTVSPSHPSLLPSSTRLFAWFVVFLWCGLSVGVASWWWEVEPITVQETPAVETTDTESVTTTEPVPTRPRGRLPVSAITVMLIAAALAGGVRSALRQPTTVGSTSSAGIVGVILCCVPVGLIVTLAQPEPVLMAIGRRCSPALAGLTFAAMVMGGLVAGWSHEQREKRLSAFTVIRRMGERRLFVPELLRFSANFPLRGLAQLFRFLDWSVMEKGSWTPLRQLPDRLRQFHDEVRAAGHGSDALVLLLSGVALITTLVWLAHTAH